MNFVKARLRLEMMDIGDTLAIILDDGEPVQNVPASFRNEGQTIEDTRDLGEGLWRVVVRKTQ
jgi:TusA-related sulfurtransferase